jgi:hypothetical protein
VVRLHSSQEQIKEFAVGILSARMSDKIYSISLLPQLVNQNLLKMACKVTAQKCRRKECDFEEGPEHVGNYLTTDWFLIFPLDYKWLYLHGGMDRRLQYLPWPEATQLHCSR